METHSRKVARPFTIAATVAFRAWSAQSVAAALLAVQRHVVFMPTDSAPDARTKEQSSD